MSIKKEVIIGDCRLLLGDCLDVIDDLGHIDAVIADPPYGISLKTNYADRKMSRATASNNYVPVHGDDKPFDPTPFLDFKVVVLFGGNYFAHKLPPADQWFIWDKRCGITQNDLSDGEIIWVKGTKKIGTRIVRHLWDGMIKASEKDQRRVHPTQKPVVVMDWIINQVGLPKSILDPFMGSGTTGVACAKLGLKFIGVEINETYFDIACERIRKSYEQPDLFVDPPKTMTQEALI